MSLCRNQLKEIKKQTVQMNVPSVFLVNKNLMDCWELSLFQD